jgi:hypothetical protein
VHKTGAKYLGEKFIVDKEFAQDFCEVDLIEAEQVKDPIRI